MGPSRMGRKRTAAHLGSRPFWGTWVKREGSQSRLCYKCDSELCQSNATTPMFCNSMESAAAIFDGICFFLGFLRNTGCFRSLVLVYARVLMTWLLQ